jgi:hypothetical protein
MPNRTPFTAYLQITPDRGTGRRFESIISAEKIAEQIYNELLANFAGNIASPGGSGDDDSIESPDGFSDSSNIVAVKPAFGNDPDQVTIVGFFNGSGAPPYNPTTILHCGQYVTGPNVGAVGITPNTSPSAANQSDVLQLKEMIESSITSVNFVTLAMVVSGVRYGRGGLHFPLA